MSFLGMFALFRRSLKPCSASRFEKEHVAWKKLDSLFKQSTMFQRLLTCSTSCLQLCCAYEHVVKMKVFWKTVTRVGNENLILFGEILTKQCNFYAAQRVVRLTRIGSLYHRLYTENTLRHMVAKLVRRIQAKRGNSVGILLGATLFSWESEKITEKDLKSCVNEFEQLSECKRGGGQRIMSCPDGQKVCEVEQGAEQSWSVSQLQSQGWECVIQQGDLNVWRKPVPSSYLYEYKVFGSFYDIPARAFFKVQMDTDYRKKWDKYVLSLDIIDKDDQGCEVLHWVMYYPYAMYSRDYVYMRRALVDNNAGVMVLMSKATDHPLCPVDKNYVRVKKYFSHMVIRPHKDFDDTGFDYLLSYFDDPDSAFASSAYNLMASRFLRGFVENLHNAARRLHFQDTPVASPCSQPTHHHSGPSLQQVYA